MILTIPLVPPSPNELRRKYRNYHAYKKLRKNWEQELWYAVSCGRHRNQLIDAAITGKKMRVTVTMHHTKEFDPDNAVGALKPVLDALVRLGYLKDDKNIVLDPVAQIKSKERKTIVNIREDGDEYAEIPF